MGCRESLATHLCAVIPFGVRIRPLRHSCHQGGDKVGVGPCSLVSEAASPQKTPFGVGRKNTGWRHEY